jgi:hypothetical protein
MRCRSQQERRIKEDRRNGQATERVLKKLELVCLACKRADCRGFPLIRGSQNHLLPENRGTCFNWRMCFQCGVSSHNRRTQCFNKTYLNNKACCECWVFKGVPGSKRHETHDCAVKGRLRHLVSYNFIEARVTTSFQEYVEKIYTSSETFCLFMSNIEKKYMTHV